MAERRDDPEEAEGVIASMAEMAMLIMAFALFANVATKFVDGLLALIGDLL